MSARPKTSRPETIGGIDDDIDFRGFCAGCVALGAFSGQPAQAQTADTSFFLTSNGIGNGGNLGGLAGADNHCQTLAQAAGAGAPRPGAPIFRRRPLTASPR